MKLIERLYDYFEANDIKPTALEKELGLSNGYFGKQKSKYASIGSDILEKIVDRFPELDLNDLVTGKPKRKSYSQKQSPAKLEEPKADYGARQRGLPYYEIDASANLINLFSDNPSLTPSTHIYIPGFEDCTGYINIYGNSMESAYSPGDIIVYKLLNEINIIQYGLPYLVVTKDDVYFRYVKKSLNKALVELHAYNTFHDPFDIAIDSIRYLAVVKGKIQRNSI